MAEGGPIVEEVSNDTVVSAGQGPCPVIEEPTDSMSFVYTSNAEGEEEPQGNAEEVQMGMHGGETFDDDFELLHEIGRGAAGIVYKAVARKGAFETVAVKVIDLSKFTFAGIEPMRARREIEVLRRISHPHIVRLHGVYYDATTLRLVMDFVEGRELFDIIIDKAKRKERLSEAEARSIFRQLADALCYLHEQFVMHRDVKPENVLILDKLGPNDEPQAMLIDFGLAKLLGPDNNSMGRTFVGTKQYLAPEVDKSGSGESAGYGFAVDMYSLGVTLYVMLGARFPDFNESQGTGKHVVFRPRVWSGVSDEAKDLIAQLMSYEPARRPDAAAALRHPWAAVNNEKQPEAVEDGMGASLPNCETKPATLALADTAAMNIDQVCPRPLTLKRSMPPNDECVKKVTHEGHGKASQLDIGGATHGSGVLQLGSLALVQQRLAEFAADAHALALLGKVGPSRRATVLCRDQMMKTAALLCKIGSTSSVVLEILDDLELAIRENEAELALPFFTSIAESARELRDATSATQKELRAKILELWEDASHLFGAPLAMLEPVGTTRKHSPGMLMLPRSEQGVGTQEPAQTSAEVHADGDERHGLFRVLAPFVAAAASNNAGSADVVADVASQSPVEPATGDEVIIGKVADYPQDSNSPENVSESAIGSISTLPVTHKPPDDASTAVVVQILKQLEEVDSILESLCNFWQEAEAAINEQLLRGEALKHFLPFATSKKPQLRDRFQERFEHFRQFWLQTQAASKAFQQLVAGVRQPYLNDSLVDPESQTEIVVTRRCDDAAA